MFLRHKATKENMLLRVTLLCLLVMAVCIGLLAKGKGTAPWNLNFLQFFKTHTLLEWYLLVLNVVTFLVFAVDKFQARRGGYRVPIVTLLSLAFAGGSLGAITAMYLLRHKTRKPYFFIGVPLIIFTQLVVLFFMMNLGRLR